MPGQAAQAETHDIGHGLIVGAEARGLAEDLWFLRHLEQQFAVVAQGRQPLDQVAGQAIVAGFGCEFGAFPAHFFGEFAFGGPLFEQAIASIGLRLADQPEFLGAGKTLGQHAVAQLVLAVQAIQFGEVQCRVVVVDEGLPLATFCQPAQPTQFHPAGLRQVAMFGEEFLDLVIAGPLESGGQLLIGQVRL
ncbi:hypothetical protein D3C86_1643660 [compost metagenome]